MRLLVACVLSVGCAAPGARSDAPSKRDLQTAGQRCVNGRCACRSVDDYGRGGVSDESGVADGMKRFELRTGRGLDQMSITVAGRGTLLKAKDYVEAECAYIDLGPGKHEVKFRARASDEAGGFVPAFFINEWGARTHDWYASFQFRCGGNHACTKDDLSEWAQTDGKKPRGVFDPCGSARVEDVHWDVSYASDVKVLDLTVELTLTVYKFVPRFPHGNATCKGAGGVEVEDAPKDLPQ